MAIADLPEEFSPAAGGAWGTDGRIVFVTGFSGLLEVSDRVEAEDASTSCAWTCSNPGRCSLSSTIRTPRSVSHRCRPTVSGSRSPPTLQDGTRCTSRAFLTRDGDGNSPRVAADTLAGVEMDGNLFYLAGNTLMAVSITSEPIFSAGAPAVLSAPTGPPPALMWLGTGSAS